MKRYLFAHIFNFSSLQFIMGCIDAMHEAKINTDVSRHLFVIRSTDTFRAIKAKYPNEDNIVLSDSSESIINLYAKQSEWVIVHGFMSLFEVFYIFPWNLHRIIWRTWGSDAGTNCYPGEPFVNFGKKVLDFLRRPLIRRFALIGVGSILDSYDIEARYGNVKVMPMYYKVDPHDAVISTERAKREHGINVLIGHSGFSNDKHIQATKYLEKYKDRDITYHYVFSYGDKPYMERAEAEIRKMVGDKAVFIKEKMPYDEYVTFLETMDLGVFLGDKSYALGNISALCAFQKWLFLSDGGLLAKAFSHYHIPYLTADEVSDMDFDTFEQKLKTQNERATVAAAVSFEEKCEKWKNIFEYLLGNNGRGNK